MYGNEREKNDKKTGKNNNKNSRMAKATAQKKILSEKMLKKRESQIENEIGDMMCVCVSVLRGHCLFNKNPF